MKINIRQTITLLTWTLFLMILFCEPALANKFETIGGGVQGSTKVKIEYLQVIAYVAGGIFITAGVLAILLHNKNAQTLNYTMWKSSSALFFILGIASIAAAVFMK
ncbi:MAG: hypothetical protein KZQ73_01050 [Candidatus Thiodiazotropha sp. (ex Semelilucina semeliformis)]|nr:hypothetical protein [Candidatus Thiodiazotropha sp. (ex Myrtea spinifera)]MCU7806449.1 hypothetical protein [Candidatus Thiodiazotropha sp. (ex Semelilucina semeliformis)]MCU7829939.1 hypothetical protein [Candidatus Thiodiazotropha sp. (ex Myrtea sp. 'scaly one' KF741663)]